MVKDDVLATNTLGHPDGYKWLVNGATCRYIAQIILQNVTIGQVVSDTYMFVRQRCDTDG